MVFPKILKLCCSNVVRTNMYLVKADISCINILSRLTCTFVGRMLELSTKLEEMVFPATPYCVENVFLYFQRIDGNAPPTVTIQYAFRAFEKFREVYILRKCYERKQLNIAFSNIKSRLAHVILKTSPF